jgi:hypothetical protein
MQMQLNVLRRSTLARWRCISTAGASVRSMPAGNSAGATRRLQVHWAPVTPAARYVETYCCALTVADFLENEPEQLYWRTDIVQMTRYFILEAARCGVRLSPRKAGFPVCPKVASAGSRVSDTVLRLWGDRNYRSKSVFDPPGYAET